MTQLTTDANEICVAIMAHLNTHNHISFKHTHADYSVHFDAISNNSMLYVETFQSSYQYHND